MSDPWPTTTIGELFEIGAGKSVTPASRNGEPKHPFLRTANVFWGRLDLTDVDSMHFSKEEIAKKALRKGDLLVCEGGDIGRSAIWNGAMPSCSFQNHLHRLRAKTEDVVPLFYMYFLQAGFTQLGIYEGAGNKTTIPNLSRSRLAALEVPRLQKLEQQKIAALLWTLQHAIQVEEKLVNVARELKQSAIRQVFERGLRGEPQIESEVGPIPQSWRVLRLGDECDLINGFAFESKDYVDSGITNFRVVNIREEGRIDLETNIKYLPATFADKYPGFLLHNADILLVMVGATRGKLCILSEKHLPALMNQNMWRIVPREENVDKRFLYYYLTLLIPRYMAKHSQEARGFFKKEELRGEPLLLPNIEEQREIAESLQILDHTLAVHELKRKSLSELFNKLLYQLMTGDLRVGQYDIDLRVTS